MRAYFNKKKTGEMMKYFGKEKSRLRTKIKKAMRLNEIENWEIRK